MSSIQPRGGSFQLRVKHRLLAKPYIKTFEDRDEADRYGKQLEALLAQGIVPEGIDRPKGALASRLLIEVIREYSLRARVAVSDGATLDLLVSETPGLRMAGITFPWAENQIARYKAQRLAPGTIRKRIECLSRVVSWHNRQMAGDGVPAGNVLTMLPRGYSAYPDHAVRDKVREIRFGPGDEEAIFAALTGVKRPDRERPWGNDPAFALLLEVIVDTGMRLREAYWMRVEKIDFARGVINVDGTKGHHGVIKPRIVPMKRVLRAKLKEWCEGKTGLVFPFWDGTAADLAPCTSRLSRRFATLFAYAMVPGFVEHDLRHEACCRWVMLRSADNRWMFNEIEICKVMGWTDTKMMLRYASLRGEDLADRLL